MGLNIILLSDLEVVVERRAYPCTKIGILLKSRKDCMLVPVLVSVVPVPKVYWCSIALGYWYRYHCLMHVDTGTSKCGTGITTSAIAPLHRSTTQGFSTAAAINSDDLHLFFGHEPLQKCARYSKNLYKHKNERNDQRHLCLHKMRAKHELGVLKSYINVALLCIQHTPPTYNLLVPSKI